MDSVTYGFGSSDTGTGVCLSDRFKNVHREWTTKHQKIIRPFIAVKPKIEVVPKKSTPKFEVKKKEKNAEAKKLQVRVTSKNARNFERAEIVKAGRNNKPNKPNFTPTKQREGVVISSQSSRNARPQKLNARKERAEVKRPVHVNKVQALIKKKKNTVKVTKSTKNMNKKVAPVSAKSSFKKDSKKDIKKSLVKKSSVKKPVNKKAVKKEQTTKESLDADMDAFFGKNTKKIKAMEALDAEMDQYRSSKQ